MKKRNAYTLLQRCSAVFMVLALLWLTVSAPFVLSAQQEGQQTEWNGDIDSPGEEESSAPGNAQEEKAPSVSSLSEEYLHEYQHTHHFFDVLLRSHPSWHADTYVAYHGELLVPPPNKA